MRELPESSECDGWVLEARWGEDFKGVRGSRRACVGWVATHKATGHRIEFKPDFGGDQSRKSVEEYVRGKNELYAAVGRF